MSEKRKSDHSQRERVSLREKKDKKSLSLLFFFSQETLYSASAHLSHFKTMSLSANLKRYATPSNVTSAAGWGGTAAVAALFLVQVRLSVDWASRAAVGPSPSVALASLDLNLNLEKRKRKPFQQQPFDFIKRALSGSSEEAK